MGTRIKAVKDLPVDEVTVEQAVEHMDPAHILCRDWGHPWEFYTARWDQAGKVYRQELKCARCHTVRERQMNDRGVVVSGHYSYPDGYLVKGMGRLTGADRDRLRLASVLQFVKRGVRRGA